MNLVTFFTNNSCWQKQNLPPLLSSGWKHITPGLGGVVFKSKEELSNLDDLVPFLGSKNIFWQMHLFLLVQVEKYMSSSVILYVNHWQTVSGCALVFSIQREN